MADWHDPHKGPRSPNGAVTGEHPGRARDPIIKVHDPAWLKFARSDLDCAELFTRAVGFTTARNVGHNIARADRTQRPLGAIGWKVVVRP